MRWRPKNKSSWTLQRALLLVPWEFTHVTMALALAKSSFHIYLPNLSTREHLQEQRLPKHSQN